ncbi:MAG: hypothetical protein PQJ58_03315 [Spirochaetales bacterium]|nr:hypothetical protein [Spirochaetales bacterium]
MAKKTAFFILLIMFVAASVLTAEISDDKKSAIYPKTMAIHKIYPHELGYRVDYMKSNRTIGTFYAPMEWFRKAAGYGELVYGNGKEYPYAVFFYEGGEISHFRLYIIEDFNDVSWGRLRGDDYTDEFSVEKLEIEYR